MMIRLIFGFTIAGFFFIGCGSQKPGSNNQDTEFHDFLADSDLNDIKESLKYACGPSNIKDTKEKVESDEDCKDQEAKLEKTHNVKIKIPWVCTQSDIQKYNRPMPAKAEFEVQAKITLSETEIDAEFDSEKIQTFLNKTKSGTSSYGHCVSYFAFNEVSEVIKAVTKGSGNQCLEKRLRSKKYVSKLKTFNDELQKDLLAREKSEMLLPLIFANYEKIDGDQFSKPTHGCEYDIFSYISTDSYSGEKSFSSSAFYTFSKNYLKNQLPEAMQTNRQCGLRIVQLLGPDGHFPKECAEKSELPNCKKQIENYKDVLDLVETALTGKSEKTLSYQFTDVKYDQSKFTALFNAWMDNEKNSNSNACDPLPVGKSKMGSVETRWGNRVYKIKRASENLQEIEINVSFRPDCDSSEFENKKVATMWLKRVNDCLTKVSPYMKSTDGQTISLKVISNSSFDAPKMNSIFVKKDEEQIRENSGLYSVSSSCAVITHEILHLTGLVDEYRETSPEYNYSCRSLGPEDSIMNNQYEAFANTIRTKASLLKPAHARHILYPGCQEKNHIYDECAQNAYRSSCERDIPQECSTMFWIER